MLRGIERAKVVLDLDGVVNWRFPAQKHGIPIIGKPSPERYASPERALPVLRHLPYKPPTLGNFLNAMRHALTPVFPDVVKVIKEFDPSIKVYGNTGRINDQSMVFMTHVSLERAGILGRFEDIYFRPETYTTTEGKLAALADIIRKSGHDQIICVDDNPGDLLPMAGTFPQVRFGLIRDLTTARLLKGVNMENYPNVGVYPTLRRALLG